MQKGIVVWVGGLLYVLCIFIGLSFLFTGMAHADEKFGMPKEAADQLLKRVEDSRGKRGITSVEIITGGGWVFSSNASEVIGNDTVNSSLSIWWYCFSNSCNGSWDLSLTSAYDGPSQYWGGNVLAVHNNVLGELVALTDSDMVGEVTITQNGVSDRNDKNSYAATMPGTILRVLTSGKDRKEMTDFVHLVGDTDAHSTGTFRKWRSTSSWINYEATSPAAKAGATQKLESQK